MSNTSNFKFSENGVLALYVGPGGDVTIPDSVTKIGRGAFLCCSDLTIHAPAGSRAKIYAKKNYIPFMAE